MVLNNAQWPGFSCAIAMALVLLLCSCGRAYRLRREGSIAILVPPVKPAKKTGDTDPYFRIKLRNARSTAASETDCGIENTLVNIHWRGKTADIQLTPEPYFAPPGIEHAQEIAPRVYLDSQQHFQGRPVPLRFDPASEDIRKLMLMPGDEISDI